MTPGLVEYEGSGPSGGTPQVRPSSGLTDPTEFGGHGSNDSTRSVRSSRCPSAPPNGGIWSEWNSLTPFVLIRL